MLTLITGQPGNGKTLYALGAVEEFRAADKSKPARSVWYSGIPELTLDWQPLEDGARWFEVPSGSVIVIDECQRLFPPRRQGAAVPASVSEFETHRHKGFDVFLITQHPQLLDVAVRKLVGRHVHVVRKYGMNHATLYQWERCVDPTARESLREALTSKFSYPRERFGWYRSAEQHTVTKDFPWRKVALIVGLLAFTVGAFATQGIVSVAFVAALGFANAMMWPAIFPLAIQGLGRFTEQGSALLIMGISGGAIIPQLFVHLKESLDFQLVFLLLMVPCYLYILYFAARGHRAGR